MKEKMKKIIGSVCERIVLLIIGILLGKAGFFFLGKFIDILSIDELGTASGHLDSAKALPYFPNLLLDFLLGTCLVFVAFCFIGVAIPFLNRLFTGKTGKDGSDKK